MARSGPANLWYLTPPPTTFAPVQRLNGGTWTWDQPRGAGIGARAPCEDLENDLAEFSARLSLDLLADNKELIVESRWPGTTAPSPLSLSGNMRRLLNHSKTRLLRYHSWEYREVNATANTSEHVFTDVALVVSSRLYPRCNLGGLVLIGGLLV